MARAGNSCHLCHTGFLESALFFCSAIKSNGRGCRKKYCDRCMSRKFPDLFKTEDRSNGMWRCPSCLLRCECANCRVCAHNARRRRCDKVGCIHHFAVPAGRVSRSYIMGAHGVALPYFRADIDVKPEESCRFGQAYPPATAVYGAAPPGLICTFCQVLNPPNSKFCTQCGQQQNDPEPSPSTPSATKSFESIEKSNLPLPINSPIGFQHHRPPHLHQTPTHPHQTPTHPHQAPPTHPHQAPATHHQPSQILHPHQAPPSHPQTPSPMSVSQPRPPQTARSPNPSAPMSHARPPPHMVPTPSREALYHDSTATRAKTVTVIRPIPLRIPYGSTWTPNPNFWSSSSSWPAASVVHT